MQYSIFPPTRSYQHMLSAVVCPFRWNRFTTVDGVRLKCWRSVVGGSPDNLTCDVACLRMSCRRLKTGVLQLARKTSCDAEQCFDALGGVGRFVVCPRRRCLDSSQACWKSWVVGSSLIERTRGVVVANDDESGVAALIGVSGACDKCYPPSLADDRAWRTNDDSICKV